MTEYVDIAGLPKDRRDKIEAAARRLPDQWETRERMVTLPLPVPIGLEMLDDAPFEIFTFRRVMLLRNHRSFEALICVPNIVVATWPKP